VIPVEAVPEPKGGHPEQQDKKAEVHELQVIASCRNSGLLQEACDCRTLAI
jgi:hypothetical protein